MFRLFTRIPRVARLGTVPRVARAKPFIGAGVFTFGAVCVASSLSPRVINEAPLTVEVDSSIDPFPLQVEKNDFLSHDWVLIGTGVRSVTFVNFKVYGVGIYIAKDDLAKTKKLLEGTDLTTLLDPVANVAVIDKLLNSGVKFLVRFSPVRNTDFNHLKDGFIKLILANPKSKEHREVVGAGLDELREVFLQNRGAVPKNHVMYLQQLPNGALKLTYANTTNDTTKELGTVNEPMVASVLLSSYMSGQKPLSKQLQQSVAAGLVTL